MVHLLWCGLRSVCAGARTFGCLYLCLCCRPPEYLMKAKYCTHEWSFLLYISEVLKHPAITTPLRCPAANRNENISQSCHIDI